MSFETPEFRSRTKEIGACNVSTALHEADLNATVSERAFRKATVNHEVLPALSLSQEEKLAASGEPYPYPEQTSYPDTQQGNAYKYQDGNIYK